jgi:hypothetical protein
MITEITINGETKQLRFDNRALEKYTQITGVDIGGIKEPSEDYSTLDMVRDLVYCGLYGYYRKEGKIFDVKIEDIDKEMGDVTQAEQLQVIKSFTSAVLKVTNEMILAFKAMGGSEEKKK